MSLTSCPECGHQVSSAADACPNCAFPMRKIRQADGPTCYECSRDATTRCQSCGTMSCAEHVQSIYVSHGRGGAYELRCKSCYSSAQTWQIFGYVFAGIAVVVFLIIVLGVMSR